MAVGMGVLGALALVAWLVLVVLTIRQILREVEDSAACALWVLVVLAAPFLGPLVWSLVRGRRTSLSGRL